VVTPLTTPSVTLIVCTMGRGDRIAPLVAQLSSVLDESAPRVEVLVVDNSSDAGLVIADDRIRVVRCTLPGLSRARTVGCIHARGDVLVFTDDDVEFDSGWPLLMAEPILDGRLDATAAPVRLGPEFNAIPAGLQREWLAEANLDGSVRLVGAGMAIHRRLLGFGIWDERLGAGRPDFAFGEETLFELMIANAGARIDVVREAEILHHPDADRSSPDHFRRMARQKGLSGAYLGYHWFGESMPMPALRAARRRLRLGLLGRGRGEVIESELATRESLGRAEGFARLQTEQRAYFPHYRARLPGSPL
jgi:glycosyltransferase involved in cell wall biosynthesis